MPSKRILQVQPVAAYDDNYIWLLSDGHCAVVVDPGDAQPVIAHLKEHNLVLQAILITHHHADHVGGIVDLLPLVKGRPGLKKYGFVFVNTAVNLC